MARRIYALDLGGGAIPRDGEPTPGDIDHQAALASPTQIAPQQGTARAALIEKGVRLWQSPVFFREDRQRRVRGNSAESSRNTAIVSLRRFRHADAQSTISTTRSSSL